MFIWRAYQVRALSCCLHANVISTCQAGSKGVKIYVQHMLSFTVETIFQFLLYLKEQFLEIVYQRVFVVGEVPDYVLKYTLSGEVVEV
jgi:hypothetical protein